MFSSVRAVLGRPLPASRSAKPVSFSCFKIIQCCLLPTLCRNFFINLLTPQPFNIIFTNKIPIFFSQGILLSAYTAVVCSVVDRVVFKLTSMFAFIYVSCKLATPVLKSESKI